MMRLQSLSFLKLKRIISLLLIGLLFLSCQEKKDKSTIGYVEINGKRAQAPSFDFIDQHGKSISDKNYQNKVYIVEFFYTSCPTICPIMNDNLGEIADKFKNYKDFGIASFSIDPEHDTPKVLKKYAEDREITHPNWHLLTGDQKDIYQLAQEDFKLVAQNDPDEPGGILHDGMFVLVDQEGYIRSRKDEFGNPIIYYRGYIERNAPAKFGQEEPQINELIEDVEKLLNE